MLSLMAFDGTFRHRELSRYVPQGCPADERLIYFGALGMDTAAAGWHDLERYPRAAGDRTGQRFPQRLTSKQIVEHIALDRLPGLVTALEAQPGRRE